MPYTLTIATQTQESVCVYTDQQTIALFLKTLHLPNLKVYDASECESGKSNKIRTLGKIIYTLLYRRYFVLRQLKRMRPTTVYFFHDSFGSMELWLVSKLEKFSEVVYCPTLRHAKQTDVQWSKKEYSVANWVDLICWRLERYPINYGDIRWFVTDSFFERNNIQTKTIQWAIPDEFQKLYMSNKKVLILVENVFANPAVEPNVYFPLLQRIIEQIGEQNVLLKNHPRFPFDVKQHFHCNCEEMNSEIPVNIVLRQFSVVIGNWSTVLFEAEQCRVKAVSLLRIFQPFYRKDLYEGNLRYLQDNDVNNKIVYPHSVEELCNIVKNYV